MKALILDGSHAGDNLSQRAHECVLQELSRRGWETSTLVLRDKQIGPCIECFGCWLETPGLCRIPDDGPAISRSIIQSQLAVFLTPLTFGGYSSHLKKALDRSICLISPFFTSIGGEVHHETRYRQYPRFLAIGTAHREDAASEQIFERLVGRNAINLHAPDHAVVVLHDSGGAEKIGAKLEGLFPSAEGRR